MKNIERMTMSKNKIYAETFWLHNGWTEICNWINDDKIEYVNLQVARIPNGFGQFEDQAILIYRDLREEDE